MVKVFKTLKFRQGIAFLVSVFILLVVFDELGAEDYQEKEKLIIAKAPITSVIKVKSITELPKMQLLATVNPIKLSQVNAQVSGKIISISDNLRQGRTLLKGQELLRIEPLPYQVALAEAKVNLLNAKVGLKKATISFAENSLTVTLAKADLSLAQRQLENAQEQLRQTNITLPFDAEITDIQAYLGEYITPGQAIASVLPQDNKQVSILVNIQSFSHLAELSMGQKISLFSLEQSQQWQGEIIAISQHNHNLQRSIYLRVLPHEKGMSINEPLYGQHLYAKLPIKGWKNTVTLPESVLTLKGEVWWLDDDNKAYKTQLHDYVLADKKVYFAQIKDIASQVVLFPLSSLSQGMKIQPRLVDVPSKAQGSAL